MSMSIIRGRILVTMNKLYTDNCTHLTDYNFVTNVDSEISSIIDTFPWFFDARNSHRWMEVPSELENIHWQSHLLHTSVCMHRIRIHRPFLHPRVGDAWNVTLTAAEGALSVYRTLRIDGLEKLRKHMRSGVQMHQIFSVAVTLAILLLVEQPEPSTQTKAIRASIELVVSDLDALALRESIPSAADESRIIRGILEMYDCPEKAEAGDLITNIHTVTGGKNNIEHYLQQRRQLGTRRFQALSEPSKLELGSAEQRYPTPDMYFDVLQYDLSQYDFGNFVDYGNWDWESLLAVHEP
ncbi:hypothetical protein EDD37DRAFT_363282 [Exophiala viscosa]|uniref:uncharacterized protein n=1 Tax=Exophiala viscosa TaxID=2486360 RepID=UPI0021A182D1|nr:hypothetical protein EDD37DRAFT_363282 [Exophiala viscosa]